MSIMWSVLKNYGPILVTDYITAPLIVRGAETGP